MEQPLLIPVQLSYVVTADLIPTTGGLSAYKGEGPKAATLNRIRARARAVRPS